MGNKETKEKQTSHQAVVKKPIKIEPWNIEALSEHRLMNVEFERKLYESISAYWEEVVVPGITDNAENETDDENKNDDDDQPIHSHRDAQLGNNDKDLTNKVIFGDIAPGKKSKRKNLEYFTAEIYEDWTWSMYLDDLMEKQKDLPPLFHRAIYHFKEKFAEIKKENESVFRYHDAETLGRNEVLEFLWIFVGYQYWTTKSCEYTLGDDDIMFDFLCKLSLLFKAIEIAYQYELFQFKKVVNHYMKPCLSNFNKEVLNRAQTISERKGLRKKKNQNVNGMDETRAMRLVYERILDRMEVSREHLLENGIEMKRL